MNEEGSSQCLATFIRSFRAKHYRDLWAQFRLSAMLAAKPERGIANQMALSQSEGDSNDLRDTHLRSST